MKTSELTKLLLAAGCYIIRRGGNHDIWYSPITGEIFPVGRHKSKELPNGTVKGIREKAGI